MEQLLSTQPALPVHLYQTIQSSVCLFVNPSISPLVLHVASLNFLCDQVDLLGLFVLIFLNSSGSGVNFKWHLSLVDLYMQG